MQYELIVRKTVSQFIEKIFRFYNYDFNHDEFKKVVYNERQALNKTEEKLKDYFDAYMYLLHNSKNILTHVILKKFFYILKCKEFDDSLLNKIINSYFYINEYGILEKSLLFHIKIKELLIDYDDLDKMIIPLMFFNYNLVKNDIPSIRLTYSEVTKYDSIKDDYKQMFIFFKDKIDSKPFYPKEYFENIIPIDVSFIVNTIKTDEELLKDKYKIKNIILYGSFSKGIGRIDSDIDLFVKISDDLLFEEKVRYINEIKEKYTYIFKRNVDIEEISNYLSDELLKEVNKIKIIF